MQKTWTQVRDAGGLFFVSHSGGKDSQAMLAHLVEDLRVPADQLVIVHSHQGPLGNNRRGPYANAYEGRERGGYELPA